MENGVLKGSMGEKNSGKKHMKKHVTYEKTYEKTTKRCQVAYLVCAWESVRFCVVPFEGI